MVPLATVPCVVFLLPPAQMTSLHEVDFDPASEGEGAENALRPPEPAADAAVVPDAAAEADIDEAVERARVQRGKRAERVTLQYEVPDADQWWLQRDVPLPIDSIVFDQNGELGQARPLDLKVVKQRVQDIRKNPPDEVIVVKCWEQRAGVLLARCKDAHLRVLKGGEMDF